MRRITQSCRDYCFTQPSFASFQALASAWILCSGRRSLTRVIQAAQPGRFKHFSVKLPVPVSVQRLRMGTIA
jgi:hypothetical protein